MMRLLTLIFRSRSAWTSRVNFALKLHHIPSARASIEIIPNLSCEDSILNKMQLVYTGLGGHVIKCLINETILQIKERIAALEGIRREQVKINSFGFPMMDSVTLYDVEAGDGVEIIVYIPRGKYRGVLVCDGKVKGQIRKGEIHFL